MNRTTFSLILIGVACLMISQNGHAQPVPPPCTTNPMNFGTVVPGEIKSIHFSDVVNALCHRQILDNVDRPLAAYFTLPTHLTNGIDELPISFDNAYLYYRYTVIFILHTGFDPYTGFQVSTARGFIQFNVGATIQVPPMISPGAYTGTVTINVIHQ